MPKYRILSGHSFRDGDKLKIGGDTIELDADMAALHVSKIEPIEDEQAPTADTPGASADGHTAE